MTAIEGAARDLAAAEAQRALAEQIRQLAYDTFTQANEAYDAAAAQVQQATAVLLAAVNPPVVERLVKRPAETADTLLGLDDVGGR